MKQDQRLGSIAAPLLLLSLWAAPVAAHISLEDEGSHLSRYGAAEIKDAPCGRKGGTRGTNIYTYAPGETITIKMKEALRHPGYFRIAFDDDGDDGFADPASIAPISRACLADPTDQCGQADFYNNDTVLMDNLNPHTEGTDQPAVAFEFMVTLPQVECDNCTLQIIQVMEDTIHGPYNPSNSGVAEVFYVEDIYHTCIDLVLSAGAPTPGMEMEPNPVPVPGQDYDGIDPPPGYDGAPPPAGGSAGAAGSMAPAGDPGLAGGAAPSQFGTAGDGAVGSTPSAGSSGCSVGAAGSGTGRQGLAALALLLGAAVCMGRRRR